MWSDSNLMEIIRPWLMDANANAREIFTLLQPELVPEKYRFVPKGGLLYRGTRIIAADYDAASNSEKLTVHKSNFSKFSGIISMTSSKSIAKEFAQGLMGNDYSHRDRRNLGVVLKFAVNPNDVIFTIGKFLRENAGKLQLERCDRSFSCENEYLINNCAGTYSSAKKSDVVWASRRVFNA